MQWKKETINAGEATQQKIVELKGAGSRSSNSSKRRLNSDHAFAKKFRRDGSGSKGEDHDDAGADGGDNNVHDKSEKSSI